MDGAGGIRGGDIDWGFVVEHAISSGGAWNGAFIAGYVVCGGFRNLRVSVAFRFDMNGLDDVMRR